MRKKNRDKPSLRIAAIQLDSGPDVNENLKKVEHMFNVLDPMTDVVVLPEVFNFRRNAPDIRMYSEHLNGQSAQVLMAYAKKMNITIIGGSIMETSNTHNAYNTSMVVNPAGEIIAAYRKIHLFDVELEDQTIKESNESIPGHHPEMSNIDGWNMGLSICYDIRFPELFRWYMNHGADVLVIPSSFTHETGKKHWHILCQARAIETQCYVIAANQCGVGAGGAQTYGHSLIIDPWGGIIAEADETTEGIIYGTLDKTFLEDIRKKFPVKSHQRNILR